MPPSPPAWKAEAVSIPEHRHRPPEQPGGLMAKAQPVSTETPLRSGLRGVSPSLLPLALMSLVNGLSYALVLPFLSLFLTTEVHAGPSQITVFLIAAPISGVLVSSWIGRLS